MRETEFMNEDLSLDTKDWIRKNVDLYVFLCEQSVKGMQITADAFSDIQYPPLKYKISREFQQFAMEYSMYNMDTKSIYYDEEFDILYVVPNNKSDENMRMGGMDVTGQVHLLWRYVYLKDELLKGQDSEFNIYKSYIFEPTPQKLQFTFLAVVVQILLTTAVCYDIWAGFPFGFTDDGDEYDVSIKIMSVMVFILLSIQTNRTSKLYFAFYENVGLMFKLPWYILLCDFISNIIINIVITLFSYLFLVQSESYSDLVLNSFALQFISEIDDMVNTFDSDEDVVIQADLRGFWRGDCKVPREITYKWREFGRLLLSPFSILESMWYGARSLASVFISKKHKYMIDRLKFKKE